MPLIALTIAIEEMPELPSEMQCFRTVRVDRTTRRIVLCPWCGFFHGHFNAESFATFYAPCRLAIRSLSTEAKYQIFEAAR